MDKLLRSTSWRLSQSHGCCGLYELYRLKASYETEKEQEVRQNALLELGLPIVPAFRDKRLDLFLDSLMQSTMGWSIPIEWGFAAILSKMMHGTKMHLVLLSDNLDDEGDVHIGPYGTKHFVKWLKEMDVGEVVETPARKSHRGRNPRLQVWIWYPDWDKIEEVVRNCMKLALEFYKEIKNVEKALDAKRRDKNRELLDKISRAAGWE